MWQRMAYYTYSGFGGIGDADKQLNDRVRFARPAATFIAYNREAGIIRFLIGEVYRRGLNP